MNTHHPGLRPRLRPRRADRDLRLGRLRARSSARCPGLLGHHGDGAARAGHLLSLADRGGGDDHHGLGDGDLLRRHPGLPCCASPARRPRPPIPTKPMRMTRKGQAEHGARHLPVVLGARRHRRHPLADAAGAAARRDGAHLLDLRELLARHARPDVRDAGGARPRRSRRSPRCCSGLLITCIGIDNPGGVPRFTLGSTDLLGGIEVDPGAGRRLRAGRGDAGADRARAAEAAAPAARLDPQGPVGADQEISEAAGAREHRRHHHRRAAGRRRRHGGLGQLCHGRSAFPRRRRSSAPAIRKG